MVFIIALSSVDQNMGFASNCTIRLLSTKSLGEDSAVQMFPLSKRSSKVFGQEDSHEKPTKMHGTPNPSRPMVIPKQGTNERTVVIPGPRTRSFVPISSLRFLCNSRIFWMTLLETWGDICRGFGGLQISMSSPSLQMFASTLLRSHGSFSWRVSGTIVL